MTLLAHRPIQRRVAVLLFSATAMLATVHEAAADDGVTGFLSSIFGGGSPQQAPTPAPASAVPSQTYAPYLRPLMRFSRHDHGRTLTVRLHRTAPKTVIAQVPAKPGKVSIFEDRTLKRGDAVMTPDGIRVFAGSASWPYTKADFIDLASAKDLNKDTTKVLAEVNRLPRG